MAKGIKTKVQQIPGFRTVPENFKAQAFNPPKFQQPRRAGFNPSTFKTQHKG